jgi:hypothetical protein
VESGVFPQYHAEDGGECQQQGKCGDECVVRQQRYQIAGFVVAKFLDHRNRETDDAMPLLPAVEPTNDPFHRIRR